MDRSDLYDALATRKEDPRHVDRYTSGNGRIDQFVRLFRSQRDSIFRSVPKNGVLLDVGGSIGDLCSALADDFSRTICLDISEIPLRSAAKKASETILADIDRGGIPLGDQTVDMVTALDFIEHIIDPVGFAKECFRVLRPGGMVFVNTPNIQFWQHLESLVVRGVFPHTSGDTEVYHGGHLAFFCQDDMTRIFGDVGFKSHLQHPDENSVPSPPIWTSLYMGPEKTMRLTCPSILFSTRKP